MHHRRAQKLHRRAETYNCELNEFCGLRFRPGFHLLAASLLYQTGHHCEGSSNMNTADFANSSGFPPGSPQEGISSGLSMQRTRWIMSTARAAHLDIHQGIA